MSTVESIEQAVRALPAGQLAEFRRWLAEFDSQSWDRQLEHDAASGKLETLASEALADFQSSSPRSL